VRSGSISIDATSFGRDAGGASSLRLGLSLPPAMEADRPRGVRHPAVDRHLEPAIGGAALGADWRRAPNAEANFRAAPHVPAPCRRSVAFIGDENAITRSRLPLMERSCAMQPQGRRFQSTDILEVRLTKEANSLRAQARLLQRGAVREATLRKARQAEMGSHITEWLRSPGLRPPK
jgi:hypothetical protein